MPQTIDELLKFTFVDKDCWIWDGGLHPQGYPMIRYQGTMQLVARIMMQDHLKTTLHKEQRVKNTCGNKLCVNPEHYRIIERHEPDWNYIHSKYSNEVRKQICDDWVKVPYYRGKFKDHRKPYGNMTEMTFRKILQEAGIYTPAPGQTRGRKKKHK